MSPVKPSDDGTALKAKSKKGGARPGAGRKPGSKNVIRAPISLKKLSEAGVDPLEEAIKLFKVAKSDAARAQTMMLQGAKEPGHENRYRWSMEYALKCLAVIMPYKYAKLAPIDALGAPVTEGGTTLNLNITDARQQFVALLNREVDRFAQAGTASGSSRPALIPAN